MKPCPLISLGMLRGRWNKPKLDLLSLRLILRMRSTLTAGKPRSTLLQGLPPKTILELVFYLGMPYPTWPNCRNSFHISAICMIRQQPCAFMTPPDRFTIFQAPQDASKEILFRCSTSVTSSIRCGGGIMGQYPSARAAAYADDGFVHDTLVTVLRILAALKHAFKEDLDMELTLPKCKVLIPGLSQEDANDAIRSVISSHAELSSLQDMVSDEALARHLVGDRPMTIQDVVKVDGLTCVGVPIGTSAFMRDWAGVKLRDQILDLQKLRLMSDPLIHYHLVRFCGLARPGYMCRTLPPDLVRDAGTADFDHAVSTEILTRRASPSRSSSSSARWHGAAPCWESSEMLRASCWSEGTSWNVASTFRWHLFQTSCHTHSSRGPA